MVVRDRSFWSGFALFAKSTKLYDFCTEERPEEITESFLIKLDRHIADIVYGRKTVFYEIHDFAAQYCGSGRMAAFLTIIERGLRSIPSVTATSRDGFRSG
jgi:hypothetical protein